jgi:type IV pilus assembly protein PilN
MRIDINLATHPYQDSRRFWMQWGTSLALLGLLTALLGFLAVTGFIRAQGDRREMAKLKSQITAYDAEKNEAIGLLNQPQNRQLREQSRFLNDLFQRKALSWTRVFEDLERVMPAHLRVLSIQPNVAGDNNFELKFLVGGDSLEQAQDLLKKMENSNHFHETRIVSEKFSSDDPNSGNAHGDKVQFEIDAMYSPLAGARETSGGMN